MLTTKKSNSNQRMISGTKTINLKRRLNACSRLMKCTGARNRVKKTTSGIMTNSDCLRIRRLHGILNAMHMFIISKDEFLKLQSRISRLFHMDIKGKILRMRGRSTCYSLEREERTNLYWMPNSRFQSSKHLASR